MTRRRSLLSRPLAVPLATSAVVVAAWVYSPYLAIGLVGVTLAVVIPDAVAWLRRWTRRTVVYKHRFGAQASQSLHYRVAYVGISNRPDLRKVQHGAGSWWHPLTDPGLYTQRWYRTRLQAAFVERWTIRRRRPIGNVQHNRAYRRQSDQRELLRVQAGALRVTHAQTGDVR